MSCVATPSSAPSVDTNYIRILCSGYFQLTLQYEDFSVGTLNRLVISYSEHNYATAKKTDLFLVSISEHLNTLQINDALQTLLGVLGLPPAAAAVPAEADEAAQQEESRNDGNADHRPEWNCKYTHTHTHTPLNPVNNLSIRNTDD